MTIKELLQQPKKVIKERINELATEYTSLTNHKPCLSCSDDVKRMIQYLNQKYMKSQFQLKLPKVIYKVKQGSGLTISNESMSDELAIEFLTVKPSRIELFSQYPDNYKELIGLESSDDSEEEIIEEIVKESSKKPCATCKDKKISSAKKSAPRKRTTTRKSGSKTTK